MRRQAGVRGRFLVALLGAPLVAGALSAGTAHDALGARIVVAAAGDIASCPGGSQAETARLIRAIRPTRVLALGDNAYNDGTLAQYRDCYGPAWGRFKRKTEAVPGNHEYHTWHALGFRGYVGFVGRRLYRSYRLGTWRLYALNSERVTARQLAWLRHRLETSHVRCILAYWHRPRFTDGTYRPGDRSVDPLWDTLAAHGADVVLVGHDHNYQRFAVKAGIREFVVGTGGTSNFYPVAPRRVKAWKTRVHGVLRIRLRRASYTWRFKPVSGSYTDSGTFPCRAKPAATPRGRPRYCGRSCSRDDDANPPQTTDVAWPCSTEAKLTRPGGGGGEQTFGRAATGGRQATLRRFSIGSSAPGGRAVKRRPQLVE
jgi:hypothetical protein